jgi:hypothetical protein
MVMRLPGLSMFQMMTLVSTEPLATRFESGLHATLLTLAVWNFHSLIFCSRQLGRLNGWRIYQLAGHSIINGNVALSVG